jgi:hypothetical protein
MSPSSFPSFYPSTSPILSPSSSPSFFPSSLPSIITPTPSSRPSSSFLPSLAIPPCQLSNSGFYGDPKTRKMNSKYFEYKYQLEYNRRSVMDEILKDVETKIANSIIKFTSIFPECSSERALLKSSSMASPGKRSLQQIFGGISSTPNDKATSEKCHQVESSDHLSCVVVEGVVTLYYQRNESRQFEESEKEIKAVIQKVLVGQSLTDTNDEIVNVTYIGLLDIEDDMSSSSDYIKIAFISLAVGVIVSLSLAFMKWRQLKEIKKDETILNEMHSQGKMKNNSSLHHSDAPRISSISAITDCTYTNPSSSDDYVSNCISSSVGSH